MMSDLIDSGLPSFLLALVLWVGATLVSRAAFKRRGELWARQLHEDLSTPARLLLIYMAARLGLMIVVEVAHPDVFRALRFCTHLFGGVAALRLIDAAFFAILRSRGLEGMPRILRSLAVWLLTFLIAAIASRMEYKFDLSSLFATSALLSVVLGFALQEPLGNLFAGLTLNAEHPFEPGDWITFNKWTGKVLDVGWRSTRLETLDDDEILVPNSFISREVVQNHSRPGLKDCVELELRLDQEVAPGKAKRVLLEAIARCPLVLKDPLPIVQLKEFHDDGVDYRLRFFTATYEVERAALDEVQQAVWYAFRRENIEIPYPQTQLSFRERTHEADERRARENLAECEDLLGRIDFVAALKPEARRLLSSHAIFKDFGPGEAVVTQGDQGDTLFLVARGEVSVRVKVDGADKEVTRLSRGAFFGEMAMLTGEPRTATVVAVGDASLLTVDRDAFSRVFAADPGVMEELAVIIAGRKAQLASTKAAGGPIAQPETQGLLSRIRSIFGKKN